jgi:hypothetical protein
MQHGTSGGFTLPTYAVTTYESACPVNTWQISATNGGSLGVAGLNNPVNGGGYKQVKPSNSNTHFKYTFYTKITADGGSTAWFGPYTLDVGCTATSVTFSNSGSFDNTMGNYWVANSVSVTDGWTMYNPTSSLAYCVVTSNEPVETDGTTASTKLNACGSQPCTNTFRPKNTNERLVPYNFKIKTTFTNGLTHVSPQVSVNFYCNGHNAYPVSNDGFPSGFSSG